MMFLAMRCLPILALLLIASSLAAQSSDTINVTLVEVPVNVIGRDGQPVRGLTAANFEILDGGDQRAITNFEAVDFGAPDLASGEAAPPPPARRNFLLLFDANNTTPASLTRAREAALHFIDAQAKPYDRVGVASVSTQSGLRLLAGFTTDRALARHAIDTVGAPQQFQARDPLLLTLNDWQQAMEAAKAAGGGRQRLDIVENYKDKAIQTQRANNAAQGLMINRQLDQI